MLPLQLLLGIALTSMFPPKDAKVFWLGSLLGLLGIAMLSPVVTDGGRFAITMLLQVAFPVACLQGRASSKIVVCIAAQFVETGLELLMWSAWMQITGLTILDHEVYLGHVPEYLVAMFSDYALCGVGLWLLCLTYRRLSSSVGSTWEPRGSLRRASAATFPLLPFAQIILVLSLIYVPLAVAKNDPAYMVASVFPIIICLLSDLLLFSQMQRYADKQLSDLRAASLEARADEYLAKAAHMQGQLRDAARLRHDLRNHVHVVEGLCERGDMAEAQAYLRRVSDLLDAGERS